MSAEHLQQGADVTLPYWQAGLFLKKNKGEPSHHSLSVPEETLVLPCRSLLSSRVDWMVVLVESRAECVDVCRMLDAQRALRVEVRDSPPGEGTWLAMIAKALEASGPLRAFPLHPSTFSGRFTFWIRGPITRALGTREENSDVGGPHYPSMPVEEVRLGPPSCVTLPSFPPIHPLLPHSFLLSFLSCLSIRPDCFMARSSFNCMDVTPLIRDPETQSSAWPITGIAWKQGSIITNSLGQVLIFKDQ